MQPASGGTELILPIGRTGPAPPETGATTSASENWPASNEAKEISSTNGTLGTLDALKAGLRDHLLRSYGSNATSPQRNGFRATVPQQTSGGIGGAWPDPSLALQVEKAPVQGQLHEPGPALSGGDSTDVSVPWGQELEDTQEEAEVRRLEEKVDQLAQLVMRRINIEVRQGIASASARGEEKAEEERRPGPLVGSTGGRPEEEELPSTAADPSLVQPPAAPPVPTQELPPTEATHPAPQMPLLRKSPARVQPAAAEEEEEQEVEGVNLDGSNMMLSHPHPPQVRTGSPRHTWPWSGATPTKTGEDSKAPIGMAVAPVVPSRPRHSTPSAATWQASQDLGSSGRGSSGVPVGGFSSAVHGPVQSMRISRTSGGTSQSPQPRASSVTKIRRGQRSLETPRLHAGASGKPPSLPAPPWVTMGGSLSAGSAALGASVGAPAAGSAAMAAVQMASAFAAPQLHQGLGGSLAAPAGLPSLPLFGGSLQAPLAPPPPWSASRPLQQGPEQTLSSQSGRPGAGSTFLARSALASATMGDSLAGPAGRLPSWSVDAPPATAPAGVGPSGGSLLAPLADAALASAAASKQEAVTTPPTFVTMPLSSSLRYAARHQGNDIDASMMATHGGSSSRHEPGGVGIEGGNLGLGPVLERSPLLRYRGSATSSSAGSFAVPQLATPPIRGAPGSLMAPVGISPSSGAGRLQQALVSAPAPPGVASTANPPATLVVPPLPQLQQEQSRSQQRPAMWAQTPNLQDAEGSGLGFARNDGPLQQSWLQVDTTADASLFGDLARL